MSGFNLYEVEKMAKIYQEERLREADMERLIQKLRTRKLKKSYSLGRVAVWLGKHMVTWGVRLQNYPITTMRISGEAK
jgi:hypothetical protein